MRFQARTFEVIPYSERCRIRCECCSEVNFYGDTSPYYEYKCHCGAIFKIAQRVKYEATDRASLFFRIVRVGPVTNKPE